MTWNVLFDDCNKKSIIDYNVLKNREKEIHKIKKQSKSYEKFCQRLRTCFICQYWSRCEYELIIKKDNNNHIILTPLFGSYELDVTDRTDFDWRGFAEYHINKQIFRNEAKIDIWNQIEYKWDEFVKYCYEEGKV